MDYVDTTEPAAVVRRELIRRVNTRWRFDAEMVLNLVHRVAENFKPEDIFEHPSFPDAFVFAWATSNGVDLANYESGQS